MGVTPVILAVAVLIAAYLLGSISFAVLFARLFSHKDVRDYGSGNAGMTNVMRVAGFWPGFLTFVCDFAKGFLSAYGCGLVFSRLYELTGQTLFFSAYGKLAGALCCMFGHVFPLFFRFRGGKGVATGIGAFFCVCPTAAVIGIAVFAVTFLLSGIISLGSLIATVATVIAADVMAYGGRGAFLPQWIMSFLIGAFIFFRHRENIRRLIKGEEKKLRIRKK